MLAGKAGVTHFHVGKAKSMIDVLWRIANDTTIPKSNLYPTHMSSRGPRLSAECLCWISHGGIADLTADSPSALSNDT
jgi:beta-aspartyl-dipeptidase (metallo-type)